MNIFTLENSEKTKDVKIETDEKVCLIVGKSFLIVNFKTLNFLTIKNLML